jgi:hypothetical protein
MMTEFHRHGSRAGLVAIAAVLGALSFSAAADDAPAARQDCSVCNDPTWPEVHSPAPAVSLATSADTGSVFGQADPTWPEVRQPSPAIALTARSDDELAADPTWPATEPVAAALPIGRPASADRVALRASEQKGLESVTK